MVKLLRIPILLICIGLIITSLGCAVTQKHEISGQNIDDSLITTKVKAAIFDEASLNTLQIKVNTFKSSVQLSGFVDSVLSRIKAGEVAGQVEGVVSVKNDLALNSFQAIR